MKKLISVILFCVFLFSFVGCDSKKPVSSSGVSSSITISEKTSSLIEENSSVTSETESKKPSVSSSNSAVSTSSASKPKPTSSQLSSAASKRRTDGETKTVGLNFAGGKNTVILEIFSDWVLNKQANDYKILRNNKEIGYITPVKPAAVTDIKDEGSGIYTQNYKTYYTIYNKGSQKRLGISFECDSSQSILYMDVIYNEISEKLFDTIIYSSEYRLENVVRANIKNGSKKILILGNSFVRTSEIGSFLQEMLTYGGQEFTVEAISIGNAHIVTFADDPSYMRMLESGDYAVVYQCGLYNGSYLDRVEKMKTACEKSNTDFILFPAHNEQAHLVDTCVSMNPGLQVLNWKAELDEFLDNGVDVFDLCYDDGVRHSKPIAGYVGAHMIYRSVFGEMPPEISYTYMSFAKSLLGNYHQTGTPSKKDIGEVYMLP